MFITIKMQATKSKRNTRNFSVVWFNTHNTITTHKGDELDVKCLDLCTESAVIEFAGTFHYPPSCRSLVDIKK
jgi:hypothetical protein